MSRPRRTDDDDQGAARARRLEHGDWQTPPALAQAALDVLARRAGPPPRAVLEPTCGTGSFLGAAANAFPSAALHGFELAPRYVTAARRALRGTRASIQRADFFTRDWDRELAALPSPLWIVGNPPWVTTSRQGALGSGNAPLRLNVRGLSGLAARTGHGTFDISEWITLRLLRALGQRPAIVGLLLKTAVARRLIEHVAREALPVEPLGLFDLDARAHFDADVPAVLFACASGAGKAPTRWPHYDRLDAPKPRRHLGVVDGQLVPDVPGYRRTRHLASTRPAPWRSGIKHDCAAVLELRPAPSGLVNGLGEPVDVEPDCLYPLLKSADVARGADRARRVLLLPQRRLGEDPATLARTAPRAWAYLDRHRARLDGRKSSIYTGRPPFSVFGVGDYSFAPYKVAIAGLYKRLTFTLVGPVGGRPVLLDDTCYFLAFDDRRAALAAHARLSSDDTRAFFEARIFWDAKRPITQALLRQLALDVSDGDALVRTSRTGAQTSSESPAYKR